MSVPGEITALLQQAAAGSRTASRQLIQIMHRELKQVARLKMSNEQSNHTLQPTAVINELFTRLFHRAGPGTEDWLLNAMEIQNRSHFLSIAAAQMRRLLIDHARAKKSVKRDFGIRIPMDGIERSVPGATSDVDVEELDKHLKMLAVHDRRAADVVEMKFFGGMTDKEVASQMKVSFATVRRDWEFARKFLKLRMQSNGKSE